jgi:DNA polymerase-3 subunit gamma/tau
MAYQVLARKYRPKRFADVVGQDHVTVTLMNALTQQRIAHGYIFSGHRGIGKTTIARILAAALNCRNPIGSDLRPTAEPCEVCHSCLEIRAGNATDVIEIDAATNRGIDEIRELRDAARYRPSRDKYKIYILDEAHQITDAAFNALLKTLEEPPDHVIFMMATTQPEDIPQTVRSRCQHFSFHAVKLVDILGQLRAIAAHEGVDADEAALSLLAEAGDGSMRDALSIMDQAIASAPLEDGQPRLDAQQIRELMGTVPNAVFERILEAVDQNRSAEVMTVANQLLDAGNSPAQLARQAVRYLRNCLIAKISGLTEDATDATDAELLQISPDEQRRAARSAARFTEEELTRFLQTMLRTFDELGYRQEQRFHFELGLLKLVHLRRLLPVEDVLSQFAQGRPSPAKAAPTAPPRPSAPPPAAPSLSTSPVAPAPAKPAFSPFAADQNRRRFEGIAPGHAPTPTPPATLIPAPPIATPPPAPTPAPIPVAAPAPTPTPAAVPVPPPAPLVPTAAPVEPAIAAPPPPAEAPIPEPPPTPDPRPKPTAADDSPAAHLQSAAIDALIAAKSQTSAADALADATWEIAGEDLNIQTELSKTMLRVVINPEAEKILRAALIQSGQGTLKLNLLPIGDKPAAPKKTRAPRSGSAQAKALEHPIVQRAQSLFHAEIRNVIDLRPDES